MGMFKSPKQPKINPPAEPIRQDSSEVQAAGDRQRKSIENDSYGVGDTVLTRKRKTQESGMGTKTILG